MKIINDTRWRTDHLRAFVRQVAADELDVAQRRHLTVTFRIKIRKGWRRSSGSVSGQASIGGFWARIDLPSGDVIDRKNLAHLIAHEFAHVRGMTHKEMRQSPRYTWVEGWGAVVSWAESLPLELVATKPRPTVDDRRSQRLEHARLMLIRWEHRAKAATGRVRRWRNRVRGYERYKLAASPEVREAP